MILEIGKLYITSQNFKTRLNSDITFGDKKYTLWVEVESDYAQYLCTERADAFLVAILPWVMINSSDESMIEVHCVNPVSERLYQQLVLYQIPILSKHIEYFNKIKIVAKCDSSILPSKNGVGTGVSGGVDSSYTMAKYAYSDSKLFKLTHGLYFNMALYGDYQSESNDAVKQKAIIICKELNVEFVEIHSNFCVQLYKAAHAPIVPYIFMGATLTLQKLLTTYYYSSGYDASEFEISGIDAAKYDILSQKYLSTQNLNFYSSGIESNRMEKVEFISKHKFSYDNLTVCLGLDQKNGNCGKCAKCTRTMAELEALGILDKYKNAFDVEEFRANPNYHFGYVILKAKTDGYCNEILEKYKELGKKIPITAYVAAIYKWIRRGFTTINKKRIKVEDEVRKL